MKLKSNIYGGLRMAFSIKVFNSKKEFSGKKVAIVGAADSVFQECNGSLIDKYDIVVRVNKSPHAWSKEDAKFVGSKFTFLYHSFYENELSGGGKIDWGRYNNLGIRKVVNPNCTRKGLLAHFNYYKRNKHKKRTYILDRVSYEEVATGLNNYIPTIGFSALSSVLQAQCQEVFITGFTFFKTPYANNYRPHLEKMEDNKTHIRKQGLHDPELEFQLFTEVLNHSPCKKILMDQPLTKLMEAASL
ncbi:glycosyltransferase family 29 protein [Zunongwangia sp. F260]|uniref:Glycosyltransferase family 29 protein n=1 Tax=Autumnicola lenta TaxID=3075593 RepID=A0ABU3CML4_9FLAO|nr:glycosyltransferase family 29 protein [Zunongwangia sp. F260]MDT0647589.1 glycosyltransferase family 29 protein [Zunongwangia sp. F260]